MVKDDKYSEKEFDSEEEMHLYWAENLMDDLNSHDKDKAKKALKKKEEEEESERERKKNLAFKGLVGGIAIVLGAILIPQMLDAADIGVDTATNQSFTLENQPYLGDADADVDVVYFVDFYCPACKSFNDGVKPQLESEYIDTGDITFYMMDFPLSFQDPQATSAAVTAQCTYLQDEDQFWDVQDELFEVQRDIDYSPDRLTQLVEDSTEGLDYDEIRSCIENRDTEDSVQADLREGLDAGVEGTPTLFINGEEAPEFSFDTLSSMIDSELEG